MQLIFLFPNVFFFFQFHYIFHTIVCCFCTSSSLSEIILSVSIVSCVRASTLCSVDVRVYNGRTIKPNWKYLKHYCVDVVWLFIIVNVLLCVYEAKDNCGMTVRTVMYRIIPFSVVFAFSSILYSQKCCCFCIVAK